MAPLMTSAGVALIWPALALDRDGLLRAFAALILACVVAALPRRWRVAGTALVVALVFFALR
jgi:hypothetical protein